MTWISLVCLLALSSSVFGGKAYNAFPSYTLHKSKYEMAPKFNSIKAAIIDQSNQQKSLLTTAPFTTQGQIQNNYAQQQTSDFSLPKSFDSVPVQSYTQVKQDYSASQSYGSPARIPQLDQRVQPIAPQHILTAVDILCKGQRPETVIPLEGGRKYVVCLDDSKGAELECQRGLYYNVEARRCERKLSQNSNPCVSQPCLNGGQCFPTEHSYQCKCASGFDGRICELDSRVCETQQPCGQSPDTRCQSFQLGAALQHVCILQDGFAYGLTVQQAQPSPCKGNDNGPYPLAFSNKGFIMCDGESMFIQSCPGGTIWADVEKSCVWPEMQVTSLPEQTYGQQRSMSVEPTYTQVPSTSYSAQVSVQRPQPQQDFIPTKQFSGY